MFVVVLSGELGGEIGALELRRLSNSYSVSLRPIHPRVWLVGEGAERFLWRLAYSKIASKVIWSGKPDDLESIKGTNFFQRRHDGFRAEVWRFDNSTNSNELKIRFANTISGKPDLTNPNIIFDLILVENNLITSARVWEANPREYESRHPQRRPVFHPTSLKPKMGKFLINLSGLKPGQRLLDPFCGVGGILIEAGLMGIKPTGIEIHERWAKGAVENTRYYGVDAEIVNEDFFTWNGGKFDAIVTDLPYGRSSIMRGEINEFYKKAFTKFKEHTKTVVAVAPRKIDEILKSTGWQITETLVVPIHRSLERWVYVCSS